MINILMLINLKMLPVNQLTPVKKSSNTIMVVFINYLPLLKVARKSWSSFNFSVYDRKSEVKWNEKLISIEKSRPLVRHTLDCLTPQTSYELNKRGVCAPPTFPLTFHFISQTCLSVCDFACLSYSHVTVRDVLTAGNLALYVGI